MDTQVSYMLHIYDFVSSICGSDFFSPPHKILTLTQHLALLDVTIFTYGCGIIFILVSYSRKMLVKCYAVYQHTFC
jgi:hypothetical protein